MQWFHKTICDTLDNFSKKEIKKLMVFMPPQHGKSELTTRTFPSYLLGKNPDCKIAIASYSATIASYFGDQIDRRMDNPIYRSVFNLNLPVRGDGFKRNSEIIEIPDREGYILTVGRGGSLTSKSVDVGIIDDPLKDREEAKSVTIREKLWEWYVDVFETRLHNDSQQILIQTRWDQDDLAGRLLERDNDWHILTFPAIKEKDINNYDLRKEGEVLWESKHSKQRILKVKETNPITFNSLYQQDPKPSLEALVYPNWGEIDEFPENCEVEFYGLDFGFTNDPTALIRIAKSNKRIFVHEEIYETGLTNPDIYKRIDIIYKAKLQKRINEILSEKDIPIEKAEQIAKKEVLKPMIYADSAEQKSIEEIRRLGANIVPAIKGPGSLNAGIDKVKEYEIYYTKSSKNIKNEKNNYQWIMIGGKPTNDPIDDYNHAMDAIRYGIFTKYGRAFDFIVI
jgi:hypothetical protein